MALVHEEKNTVDSRIPVPTKLSLITKFDSSNTKNKTNLEAILSLNTESTLISEFHGNDANDLNRIDVKISVLPQEPPLLSSQTMINKKK